MFFSERQLDGDESPASDLELHWSSYKSASNSPFGGNSPKIGYNQRPSTSSLPADTILNALSPQSPVAPPTPPLNTHPVHNQYHGHGVHSVTPPISSTHSTTPPPMATSVHSMTPVHSATPPLSTPVHSVTPPLSTPTSPLPHPSPAERRRFTPPPTPPLVKTGGKVSHFYIP